MGGVWTEPPLAPLQVRAFILIAAIQRNDQRRYYSGDVFQEHVDTCYTESDTLRSFYTVNIYLNDAFEDGRTRFFDDDHGLTFCVQPKPGLALIFAQPAFRFYPHDGERVTGGTKYLIRSDVMYRRLDQ